MKQNAAGCFFCQLTQGSKRFTKVSRRVFDTHSARIPGPVFPAAGSSEFWRKMTMYEPCWRLVYLVPVVCSRTSNVRPSRHSATLPSSNDLLQLGQRPTWSPFQPKFGIGKTCRTNKVTDMQNMVTPRHLVPNEQMSVPSTRHLPTGGFRTLRRYNHGCGF